MGDLVSIITPMYNAQKYIAQTMDSVLAQTYSNWEMIIMDDCSTDSCPEIVKEYCRKDSRIKYFKNKENQGVSGTRNAAMQKATGRYLAFLDSDDLWNPEKLSIQISFMEQNDAHFCCTGCCVIDENGKLTGQVRHVPPKKNYRQMLKGNSAACLTVVVDRKYIDDPIMPEIPHEDYAAWLNAIKDGEVVYGIDQVLASYRVAGNSVSGNKIRAALWTWSIYRDYLHIPLYKSIFYFICYAWNAVAKRV